jgi:hypothetical protein
LLDVVTVAKEVTVPVGPNDSRGVATGLHRDDLGGDRPDVQGGPDPRNDVFGAVCPVQEEDVDELAGAVGVAVDPAGGDPEVLVRGREHPGCSRLGQGG